ncbi:MAG: glycosyltransferase family 4 protein [Flavobacteriales bacterium]
MRVAYITHYADLYGANRSLLELIGELQRRGDVEPHVLLPQQGPLVGELERMSVPYRIIPFETRMVHRDFMGGPHHRLMQRWRYARDARGRRNRNRELLPAIIDQVKAWRVQLIHANSSAVSIAPDVSSEASIPLIWHIRELLALHYGIHPDSGRSEYGRSLRDADRLIGISEAVREDVARYTALVRPLVVVYNGVVPKARYAELRSMADERWSTPGSFTFAMVGLIHPSKGHLEALDALRLVLDAGADVRLIIAGDGRMDVLHERITALGLAAHVELPGFVENAFDVYNRSHAVLMCSRHEAMGRVTVEAMASGLAVIGHASGGTLELLRDPAVGILYNGGAEELARHMLGLVGDPVRARRLGEHASLQAESRFSVERCADEVWRVYQEVRSTR